jgi:transcriptional repressor NrdR
MKCPYCSFSDSKVTDSRTVENGIRRRRECQRCRLRFTTYERVQTTALLVAKRDGRREEYNRDKLAGSVRIACAKRPIPIHDIDKVLEDIEAELQRLGRAEIPASSLGEMVIERLRRLDRVAYVRFASVYRDFQDIESFERVVQDLKEEPTIEKPKSDQLAACPSNAGQ